MKMQYKCEPTADQLFKLTHTRRVTKKKNLIGDGEEGELIWIDKKSQRIYAKMRRFRSPTESIPAKSAEPVPTKPASVGDEDGYAPISQILKQKNSLLEASNAELQQELQECRISSVHLSQRAIDARHICRKQNIVRTKI